MLPLYENTLHLFNKEVIGKLKKGVMIINTSRGGLIDTDALIEGLQTDVVKAAALDVYENEAEYFFRDMSSGTMKDSTLARLIGMANVIITPHQVRGGGDIIRLLTLSKILTKVFLLLFVVCLNIQRRLSTLKRLSMVLLIRQWRI